MYVLVMHSDLLTLAEAAQRARVDMKQVTEARQSGDLRETRSRFRADHVDSWSQGSRALGLGGGVSADTAPSRQISDDRVHLIADSP